MDLNMWFERGLTAKEYISSMQINQEEMLHITEAFSLTDIKKAQKLQKYNLRALILTADWCGDAMVNLPIFMNIAKEANIESRFFIRDENLELMDQYLTNGTARSIPIIILIDENGKYYTKWGPRAKSVQELVDEYKRKVPAQNDPEYKEAFRSFINKLTTVYKTDSSIWSAIEEDMLNTFIKK